MVFRSKCRYVCGWGTELLRRGNLTLARQYVHPCCSMYQLSHLSLFPPGEHMGITNGKLDTDRQPMSTNNTAGEEKRIPGTRYSGTIHYVYIYVDARSTL